MKYIKKTVLDFLANIGMDFYRIDIKKEYKAFLEDMHNGLAGKKSSLYMLPTFLQMKDDIPSDDPVIVMDAGGTNFRTAVVYFDENKKPIISDFSKYPMPGVEKELNRKQFLQTIVEYLKPVLNKSNRIGFCFSYPVDMLPSGDGILIRFNKEVKVEGMNGRLIGAEILKAIKEAGYAEEKSIVLLNDTAAALLGGKAAYGYRNFDSFVGFILGTGINTCYVEKGNNLVKLKEHRKHYENMLINLESGAYNRFPSGKSDIEYDLKTDLPGEFLFEKKVAGAYLGGLARVTTIHAIEEGLFSKAFNILFRNTREFTTIDLNKFMHEPFGDNLLAKMCDDADEKDRSILYYLFDCLIERAAKLAAINIIAVLLKTGKGKDPTRPVCITADGSTFYKLKNFKQKLEYYLKVYLIDDLNIYYEFMKVQNSNLIGSAIAALNKLD
ncbi:MAG: hexokinase [Clostridiaceae bacterium]|nr:hexokinase [Clostridiaceae bacterium]